MYHVKENCQGWSTEQGEGGFSPVNGCFGRQRANSDYKLGHNERGKPFDLIHAPQVTAHLHAIERKYHPLIRRTIENQPQFEPDREAQNRKPLKRHAELEADWEIRFGPGNPLRVPYSVDKETRQVFILVGPWSAADTKDQ
jgi:hypothetical protein